MPRLVLASTSPFRKQLLSRLGLPFETLAPGTDELEIEAESPSARAQRLSLAKAEAVLGPGMVAIGSDQVAALGAQILHKPRTPERAIAQLMACQGRSVDFFTGVAVCTEATTHTHVDHTRVRFRRLPRASLEYYITQDDPLQCAGGFKVEGLGISLFEHIRSDDPTALIGLPLIWLTGALRTAGIDPLSVGAATSA